MPRPVTLKKLKLNGFLGRGCKRMTELTFCWTYIMVAKLNQHSIRLFHTTFQILATLHPHSWYSSNELEWWSNCPLKIKVVFHHFRLHYHSYLPAGSCNTWMDSCPWGWGQRHSLSPSMFFLYLFLLRPSFLHLVYSQYRFLDENER